MSGTDTGGNSVSVGSTADMVGRIRAVLPFAWFPAAVPSGTTSETPVLDSVLSGIGTAWSFCYSLLGFVRSQARLATATGSFLDLFAIDFFGTDVARRAYETDDAFRTRLSASLLLPRATRSALSDTLFRLVGVQPHLFEPNRAVDTGAFGQAGLGYGSTAPFQYLISLDANAGAIRRETVGTFLDSVGQLHVAPRHTARPVYANGYWTSFLVEAAGFNLLKDSLGFTGWTISPAGAITSWAVDAYPGTALLANSPVLEMTVSAEGSFSGPATSVFVGDQTMTASAWIWLPSGHQLTEFRLQFGDGVVNPSTAADLTIVNAWQRLVTTHSGVSGQARTVTAWLIGTSKGATTGKILTQCWQVEPGAEATTFIPSAGQIGVRDQDRVVGDISTNDPVVLTQADIVEAIERTVPAGSIAWLNIQLRQ